MRIDLPFYHDTGHGLYASDDALHWVTLRRSGTTVSLTGTWSVPVHTRKDRERALARLIDRVAPHPQVVATHLPPQSVRCAVVDRPSGREEAAWLRTCARDLIPDGTPADAFILRARPLEPVPARPAPGHTVSTLVVATRREAVDACRRWLAAAGLTPILVGDVRADLAFAFAWDGSFSTGEANLLWTRGDRACLLQYRAGRLTRITGGLPTEPAACMSEAAAAIQTDDGAGDEPLRVVSAGADAFLRAGPAVDGMLPVEAGTVRCRDEAWDADPEAIPAVAYAVKALHVHVDAVNLLAPRAVRDARDVQDRPTATRVLLGVAIVVGGLLLLATVASLVLEHRVAGQRDVLRDLQSQIDTVEAARQQRDAVQAQLHQSMRLVYHRTQVAHLLERVGRAVPEDAWLDALDVARSNAEAAPDVARLTLHVVGYATDGEAVRTLLAALEATPSLDDVTLLSSEVLSPEDVFEATDALQLPLTRFEVRVRQRPSSPP